MYAWCMFIAFTCPRGPLCGPLNKLCSNAYAYEQNSYAYMNTQASGLRKTTGRTPVCGLSSPTPALRPLSVPLSWRFTGS